MEYTVANRTGLDGMRGETAEFTATVKYINGYYNDTVSVVVALVKCNGVVVADHLHLTLPDEYESQYTQGQEIDVDGYVETYTNKKTGEVKSRIEVTEIYFN